MSTFVYKMYDEDDAVLYVGITDSVKSRVRQHSEKAWFPKVAWIETIEFATRDEALQAETALIQSLRPPFNRSQNPDHIAVPTIVPTKVARTYGGSFARQGVPDRKRHYISMTEAAEHLGVTTRTIRQMVADGRITGYRSGKRLVRLDLNELDAAMQPFGGKAIR